MFGPGATLLAKEFESNLDKKEELISSDTEVNSDNEVEHMKVGTQAKDQRKKRVRTNIKYGDRSNIEGMSDNHGVSSEGEHSEETIKEVKKPRLGEGSETHEGESNIEILVNENIPEDKSKNLEELSEGKMGGKDHTEGMIEKDNILKVLLDMHEDVPLQDPGPNIASKDREEGVAGATQ